MEFGAIWVRKNYILYADDFCMLRKNKTDADKTTLR